MTTPATQNHIYEDIYTKWLHLPDNIIGEILHGQLHTQPRPATRHALASTNLTTEIHGPFHKGRGGPGGWWIVDEPEIHLDDHIIVPDLAGWKREHMPIYPKAAYFSLPPDWICEILSPSTTRVDRAIKMPLYASYHIPYCWLIDPEAETLEVFILQQENWLLWKVYQAQDTIQAPPFEVLGFLLEELWH